MKVSYRVDGMTCGGCARAVTRVIEATAAGVKVTVDLPSGRVDVEGEHDVARVHAVVEQAGYTWVGAAFP